MVNFVEFAIFVCFALAVSTIDTDFLITEENAYSSDTSTERFDPLKWSAERTDCRSDGKKKHCCRQRLQIEFKNLKLPNMHSIVQPKRYETGYCTGTCPLNYNYASNHSRIQHLLHRMNKTVPRVCCVPSKLRHLELLREIPHDPTKLEVERWDNMIVLECACS